MDTFRRWSCLLVAFVLFSTTDLSASQGMKEVVQISENAYNEEQTRPMNLPKQNSTYDFIIVGSSPAGCVLAHRLSENPEWKVLMLEAGATESLVHDLPVMADYLQSTTGNWKYLSTPQNGTCQGTKNNQCALPRGKQLGGTSTLDFMVYNRGNPKDYDNIAADGNYEWAYKKVLPLFKRSERANSKVLGDSSYHNTSGLQSVEFVKYGTTMGHAFVEASKELGYQEIDYNGQSHDGTAYVQGTTLNGHRHSAAKAFIAPILNERDNLDVFTFATVTKILIDDTNTAYGVQFVHRNITYTIKAKKEVILSAGPFNSPQLLMLSGIGPSDALEPVGIKQLVDRPVGKNLYDQVSHFGPVFTTNATGETLFSERLTSDAFTRYHAGDPSTILSTLAGFEAVTYVKPKNIDSSENRPNIEISIASGSMASDYGTDVIRGSNLRDEIYTTGFKSLEGQEHFTLILKLLLPKSMGRVYLKDSNPFTPPIIDPNYFAEQEDVQAMLDGINEALRFEETPAMKKINTTLFTDKVSGCKEYDFGTNDYWKCSIRVLSFTLHYQAGTCKMGRENDPTSVVSPQLKVHGVRKLRVADNSVLPKPCSAHTSTVGLMIGEKASDLIRTDWQQKKNIVSLSLN